MFIDEICEIDIRGNYIRKLNVTFKQKMMNASKEFLKCFNCLIPPRFLVSKDIYRNYVI